MCQDAPCRGDVPEQAYLQHTSNIILEPLAASTGLAASLGLGRAATNQFPLALLFQSETFVGLEEMQNMCW